MSRSPSSCFQQTSTSRLVSGPVTIQRERVAGSLQPSTTQKDVAAMGSSDMGSMLRDPCIRRRRTNFDSR